jgi:hypothetical protein
MDTTPEASSTKRTPFSTVLELHWAISEEIEARERVQTIEVGRSHILLHMRDFWKDISPGMEIGLSAENNWIWGEIRGRVVEVWHSSDRENTAQVAIELLEPVVWDGVSTCTLGS